MAQHRVPGVETLLLLVVLAFVLVLPAGAALPEPSAPAENWRANPPELEREPGPGNIDSNAAAAEEIPALRSRSSRTYVNRNGSMVTRLYGESVNYRDPAGAWKPIENHLVDSPSQGFAFENAANRYSVLLPGDAGERPVRMQSDGAWVDFQLRGATGAGAADGATATYPDARHGLTLAYTARADGVKEEIRVDSPEAAQGLVFDVRVSEGLTARLATDAIEIRDASGAVRFHVARPFMYDAAGESSHAVSYALEATTGGYALAVRPDREWLTDSERQFPVVIDPTTTMEQELACTISSAAPNTSACLSDREVGYDPVNHGAGEDRGLLHLSPSGAPNRRGIVLSAKLRMNIASKTTSNQVPLSVHDVQASSNPADDRPWDDDVTWNQWDTGDNWTTPGGDFNSTPLDTVTVGSATGWHDWYLDPHEVQKWVQRQNSKGLLLKTGGSSGPANHFVIESTDPNLAPYLEMTWDQRNGQKAEYTFDSQQLSDRMDLAVNMTAGNLMLRNTDVRIAGTGLDYVLSRTWNSLAVRSQTTVGRYWKWDSADDVRLDVYGDGSVAFFAPGYLPLAFHKTGANQWAPPPGTHAKLETEGSGYKLTFRDSLEVWHFRSDGLATELEDRNGNGITFNYNTSSKLMSVTDTQGRTVTFDYTGAGEIEEIVDPAGRHYQYGITSGQLTSYTDPDGKTTYYEYDAQGSLSKVTDPRGNEIRFTYDVNWPRVTSIKRVTNDPNAGDGPTWNFYYDTDDSRCPANTHSNLAEDPRGNDTLYCYDDAFRVVKTIDAEGKERSQQWSPTNKVTSATAPGSATTTFGYDSNDNLDSVDEPAGENNGFEYTHPQHERFMTGATSPQGTTTSFSYDSPGNLTSVSDGGTQVEANLEYNGTPSDQCTNDPTTKAGTLRCAVDGKGNITNYGYDDQGNLTSITPELPLGDTTITYDSVSRIQTIEDGKAQTREFTYDPMDRVTLIEYSNGDTIAYDYDANGNMIERDDSVHGVSIYEYDKLNRRIEDSLPSGDTDYDYDRASNLISLTDSGGTVTYRYDTLNRLKDLAEPGGTCSGTPALCTTFGYTNRDQRNRTTYPNGVEQTVEYDSSDKPTRIRAVKGALELTDFTYTYDLTSPSARDTKLRQTATDKDGNTIAYGYDFLDRLTSAIEKTSGGTTIDSRTYEYDLASNRTKQIINGATTTFRYNEANQLCHSVPGTPSGTCATPPSGATTYTYDANGNTLTNSVGLDFDYNIKDQTTSYTPAGGTATSYTYAGPNPTERSGVGSATQHNNLLGVSTEGTTRWVRGDGGELVSQKSGSNRHYYLSDALGSTVGLTDSSGSLARSYKYDPYGETVASTGSLSNPFQFAGEYREAQGSLYKIGARYYQPGLGRWTQADPLDQPGDLRNGNRYVYAGGDPVNLSDPTGLSHGGSQAFRIFRRCMAAELSFVSNSCIEDCFSCALVGFNVDTKACFHCVACAGPRAFRAVRYCYGICR
jgi:RHS repeat-associated protein